MYSKLSPFGGNVQRRLFGKYLIGIAVLGVFDLDKNGSELEYFFGIGNGRGLDASGNDKNNNRAINARLIYRPAFLYGLQVGASLYDDINFYGISGLQNAKESSFALDLQYENSNIQIQAESMFSSFETKNSEFQKSRITYFQVAYTLMEVFTPFVNYTTVKYDLNNDDNAFTRFNFGLNYSILPNLFLKGEVQFHSAEEEHNALSNFTTLKITVAVAF